MRQAGGVQAFLFTKKPMWAQKARSLYIFVVSDTEGNVHCTPLWSALGKLKFERAQVSFGVCKHK